jgi:hypothetical protein
MLPSSPDWIAALSRMSGKSVTASMSTTPQAWLAKSPCGTAPIASRTRLRAPSHPTTYLARTTFSEPLDTSFNVTTTG